MCPSSGEITVSLRRLVFVTLCGRLSGMWGGRPPYIPDSHPHRITSTKCRKNTVVSSDDGHIVARNMWRLINIQGGAEPTDTFQMVIDNIWKRGKISESVYK